LSDHPRHSSLRPLRVKVGEEMFAAIPVCCESGSMRFSSQYCCYYRTFTRLVKKVAAGNVFLRLQICVTSDTCFSSHTEVSYV
jgi:hypothetical protein